MNQTTPKTDDILKRALKNPYTWISLSGFLIAIFGSVLVKQLCLFLFTERGHIIGTVWMASLYMVGLFGGMCMGMIAFATRRRLSGLRKRAPLLSWRVERSQWGAFKDKHAGPGALILKGTTGLFLFALVMISWVARTDQSVGLAVFLSFLLTSAVCVGSIFVLPYTGRDAAAALYKDCAAINGHVHHWGERVLSAEVTLGAEPGEPTLIVAFEALAYQRGKPPILIKKTHTIPVPLAQAAEVRSLAAQIEEEQSPDKLADTTRRAKYELLGRR